jgi:hypothetical protein
VWRDGGGRLREARECDSCWVRPGFSSSYLPSYHKKKRGKVPTLGRGIFVVLDGPYVVVFGDSYSTRLFVGEGTNTGHQTDQLRPTWRGRRVWYATMTWYDQRELRLWYNQQPTTTYHTTTSQNPNIDFDFRGQQTPQIRKLLLRCVHNHNSLQIFMKSASVLALLSFSAAQEFVHHKRFPYHPDRPVSPDDDDDDD